MGNKAWYIAKARKSHTYEGDMWDKDICRKVLRDEFGIHAVEPLQALECLDGSHMYPDLRTTNYNPTTYIELHGPYHEQINDTSDYTYRKYKKYEELKLNLIEIWADQPTKTPKYSKSHLIAVLIAKGIRKRQ